LRESLVARTSFPVPIEMLPRMHRRAVVPLLALAATLGAAPAFAQT
jgi:hypothetical protein